MPATTSSSQASIQGNRSHSSGTGVLPGVWLAPGSIHLHANTTPTSFHPSPSMGPSLLYHHSQPGGPQSGLAGVPHLRILHRARQSNLLHPSPAQFDPSGPTCRGDIVMAPPDLQILLRWTKTHQSVGRAPVLSIPEVPRTSPQTQSQPTVLSSPLRPTHHQINLFIPIFTGGVAPQSLSPSCPKPWLPSSMTSGMTPDSSPSTACTVRGLRWLTGRALTRSTSNIRDCGPMTPSGSTSLHHALPPRPS